MGNIIDASEVLLNMGLSGTVTDEERAIVNTAIRMAEGAVIRYLKYDPVQRTRTEYYPQQDFNAHSRHGIWEVDGNQAIRRRESLAATRELQVQHIPIRSITSLSVDLDGRFGTKSGGFATNKVQGDDFWPHFDGNDDDGNGICRDGIIESIGVWSTIAGSTKIVYIAGYSEEEFHGQKSFVDASPIVESLISEASRKAETAFHRAKKTSVGFVPGTFTSEKLGDYAYTVDAASSTMLFGRTWTLMPETREALSDFINYGAMLAM